VVAKSAAVRLDRGRGAPVTEADPPTRAAPVAEPPRRRTVAIGLLAALLGACAVALVAEGAAADERFTRAVLEALIIGVPVAVGLYAMGEPRSYRFGMLLIAAGVAWSLTALGESSESLPYSIGRLAAWTIHPIVVYLMLAFPTGRLATRLDRTLFGVVACLIVFFYTGSALLIDAYPSQTPWATCDADCPANAFQIVGAEPAWVSDVLIPVRELASVAVLLCITGVLIHRVRTASGFMRRTLMPVVACSAAFTLTLCVYLIVRRSGSDGDAVELIGQLWSLTIPAFAVAFGLGLVQERAQLADTLSRLSLTLSHRLDPAETRDTLAAALGGERLELLLPEEGVSVWRDTDGRRWTNPELRERGFVLTLIRDDAGEPAAALAHEPALSGHEEIGASVRALILAALEHRRVTGRLARSLEELKGSRNRIARAADAERSRIERDLHDGAQQRLIAMRIRLTMAEERIRFDPDGGLEDLHALGLEIDVTLEELRALAHGIYPSLLADRGLIDALRGAAGGSPLPVEIVATELPRFPEALETAVYFTCREAIQNATKHAEGASRVRVRIWTDDMLRFEVNDDGAGFVPSRQANGGLRNMHDRIEAVGGRVAIASDQLHGTNVRGFVPFWRSTQGFAGDPPAPPGRSGRGARM
jgi:signal transduction histidine kinase